MNCQPEFPDRYEQAHVCPQRKKSTGKINKFLNYGVTGTEIDGGGMADAWALKGRLTSIVGQFGEYIKNSPVLKSHYRQ